MNSFLKKNFFIFVILILSAILRFTQLGYSHFYGDETKAIYFKKNIGAMDHFFNQRKGPGQFLVAWTIEKTTNSYSELFMRVPSAIFGVASVYVLYLVSKKLFNERVALIASIFFSLNGLYIAFSRIIQYQSFYVFFGLLSLLFIQIYLENNKKHLLLLSSFSMAIAFLFHYDSIFILIPCLFQLFRNTKFKSLLLYYFLPFIFITSLYYVPYLVYGIFRSDTLPYLLNRVTGKKASPSSTFYTYYVYNPLYFGFVYLLASIFSIKHIKKTNILLLLLWFIFPFILFQFVFKSAGTHIHNFILPLIILSAYIIDKTMKKIYVHYVLFVYIFLYFLVQSSIFLPYISTGYPWTSSKMVYIHHPKVRNDLQVFIYGFPYNRGWDKIHSYTYNIKNGVNFYTNDNLTIGEFYLRDYFSNKDKDTKIFVDVLNNQQSRTKVDNKYLDNNIYTAIGIYNNSELTATLYLEKSLLEGY